MTYQADKKVSTPKGWGGVIALWVAITATGFAGFSGYRQYMQSGVTNRTVRAVCEYTRTTDTNEEACAIAQDASDTTYKCDEYNNSVDNNCWVERR